MTGTRLACRWMRYFQPHAQAACQICVSRLAAAMPIWQHLLTLLCCMQILANTADQLKNFAVIYCVDLSEIPDFNTMYELYDPCTVMFFFRNKHIMIDLGTGNNNKINWAMNNKQEFIDIVEVVYRGARKGRGLVVSPKGNQRSVQLSAESACS